MLSDFKRKLLSFYINSRGWRTRRKLVVIESDDWGSIRMPSRDVYEKFLALGYPVDKLSYLKYDSLESNSDLESLFEVLTSFKDQKGNHPVVTANTIMTNPDFDRIRQSNFEEYHYELFTETLKRYPEHDRVLDFYREGIKKKIFYPQLHGREHLNVNRWMKALQSGNDTIQLAFNHGFYDLGSEHTIISEVSFVDSLSPSDKKELVQQEKGIAEAVKLFEIVFGYAPKTFIAPCYVWRPEIETAFSQNGIKILQSGAYQLVPEIGKVSSFTKRLHFTGEKSKSNIQYTVRNCYFEPSTNFNKANPNEDVQNTINQIEYAFSNKKPAIITSHRVNYIGLIEKSNRMKTLEKLSLLLKTITKKWPDVEFITSADLADIITS
jgi:hypothetical protein